VHCDSEVFWRADGSSFPVEYWSYPVIDGGVIAGAVVAFIDITERRRSEELVKNILETVDEGFMVVDPDFGILLANRALGALVGLPLDQIVGRACHEIFHGQINPCSDPAVSCLMRENVLHWHADGRRAHAPA